MKRLFLKTVLLALICALSLPAAARADVNISIGLPPPIVFSSPPEMIVLPDTYVYVVPDVEAEIFFYDGWWWRPWEGRWYRSAYYDRDWGYYNNVPSFYFDVDPGWRGYYRDRNWYGHRWNYERISNRHVHQNWKSWQNKRHWERQGSWGVQGYKPRPQKERQELRQQRQQQYQQRPEVQKHREQRQERVKEPQRKEQKSEVREPRQQRQERVKEPQRKEQKSEVREPRQQRQERVKEPQRKEQKSEVREPRQQHQEKSQKPERSKSKDKHKQGDEEKQDYSK